jgi:hypothetical protein
MSDEKYAREIRKTGFVLEYKVAEMLRHAGWTVISNKYYEDDHEGNVREIDLLAYKVSQVQQISVYTTILISCKKNEADIWALLARDVDLKDPNVDWWPLHTWSNDYAVNYEVAKPTFAKNYHDRVAELGVTEVLSIPKYEVFAFQEMNRSSGAPHNDKNIFSAVTSLLKAQAYELGALPQRKKKPTAYQFNLLSIIDSDLFRLVISNDEIRQEAIESEHYISRYIIKRRETFSRIHFVAYSGLKKKIDDYDRLHKANCKRFDEAIATFYDGILKDHKRVSVLIEDFRTKISWDIYFAALKAHGVKIEKQLISLGWDGFAGHAKVEIACDSRVIDTLNADAGLRIKTVAALKEIYRYTGEFNFEVDELLF